MTEEKKQVSLWEFLTKNEQAYQDATKKLAESLERGRICRKALFTSPHRDIAVYCAQNNGADAETLTSRFGDEVPKLLDELMSDGIVVAKDSTYHVSEHIRELYKNHGFIKLMFDTFSLARRRIS